MPKPRRPGSPASPSRPRNPGQPSGTSHGASSGKPPAKFTGASGRAAGKAPAKTPGNLPGKPFGKPAGKAAARGPAHPDARGQRGFSAEAGGEARLALAKEFRKDPRRNPRQPRPDQAPESRAEARFPMEGGSRPPRGRAPADTPAAPPRSAERDDPARGGRGGFPERVSHHHIEAPRPAQPTERPENGTLWIHGLHAVSAALANPRRQLRRLLLTQEAEAALAERLPKPWRLPVERVEDRARFNTFLPEDAVHQGAALLVHNLPTARLDAALAASDGPVLLLDQVTDPRNVGAILRSAAAFGAAAVVMQDRHAPPETAALARAASGALETVPVVREVNLSRVIQTLQAKGFWVMGLAGDATRTLAEAAPRDRRVALVLGAEDSGLRRLQRENCDELVRLPISSAMESLNVSAAATVALYEIARAKPPVTEP